MILFAVEAVPAGSKPSEDVGLRLSTGERHCFGTSAPLPTKASPMDVSGAGGSAFMPKLVKLDGPSLTLAGELSPSFTRSAVEAPSVRLRVLVYGFTPASLARRGCRASCVRPAKR